MAISGKNTSENPNRRTSARLSTRLSLTPSQSTQNISLIKNKNASTTPSLRSNLSLISPTKVLSTTNLSNNGPKRRKSERLLRESLEEVEKTIEYPPRKKPRYKALKTNGTRENSIDLDLNSRQKTSKTNITEEKYKEDNKNVDRLFFLNFSLILLLKEFFIYFYSRTILKIILEMNKMEEVLDWMICLNLMAINLKRPKKPKGQAHRGDLGHQLRVVSIPLKWC
ncbi:hypothetical protein BY996DRAFT_1653530 [Phakopsora pachyrhizi]|nr:hypothetical protein BY996DRAFT_1653530 [Phakopsora pachyrhizi]